MVILQLLTASSLSLAVTLGPAQTKSGPVKGNRPGSRQALVATQSINDGTLASVRRSDRGDRGAGLKPRGPAAPRPRQPRESRTGSSATIHP